MRLGSILCRFTPGGGICASGLRPKVALPLAEPEAVAFVPAVIEPSAVPDPAPTQRPRRQRRTAAAAVELEIDGVAVKIDRDADAGAISAAIEALRATR